MTQMHKDRRSLFQKEPSRGREAWRWLTRPSVRVKGRDDLRQAEIATSVTASIFLLVGCLGGLGSFLVPLERRSDQVASTVFALILFGTAWAVSRSQAFRWVGFLSLGVALLFSGIGVPGQNLVWGLLCCLALLGLVPLFWRPRVAIPFSVVTAAATVPVVLGWPFGIVDAARATVDLALGVGIFGVVGHFRLRHIEEIECDLVETRDRYRALLETVFEGILVVRDGVIVSANPGFRELVGPREAELRGRGVGELLLDRQGRPLAPVEGVTCHASLAKGSSEVPIDLEVVCRRLRQQDGSMLLAVRDITADTRLIATQLRVERLDSLSLIAGGIAHDFNNLLTAVLANLNLLQLFEHEPAQLESGLGEVEKAALRAQDLAQQLLAFSREEGSDRQPQALAPLVESVAKLTLRGTRVLCSLDLEPVSAVEVDIGKIHQVLVNLFVNATEAMPRGGTIQVKLREGDENLPVLPAGRYVCLEVKDDGPGIRESDIEKIFDPYFSTKDTGNGLGLATSFSIARQHEGLLTVESSPGEGATFRLYLPASDAKIPQEEVATTLARFHGTVLVLDDDPGVRQVLSSQLRVLGLRVHQASTVEEAVRLYEDSVEQDWRYALVILDLTIPGGRGGIEAFRQIRELDPEARAMISSGYVDHPAIGRPRDYGFCAALRKPYTLAELSESLGHCLAVSRREVADWPAALLHEPTSQFPVYRDGGGVN